MDHPLKNRRRELGLTQRDAAALLGVTKQYIGLIERNEKHPSRKLALLIESRLSVRASDLIFPGSGVGRV